MNSDAALDEAILNPDLRHINFFNGRLLTGGDLQAEQAVQHAHARLLGNAIGSGVVEGLYVTAAVSSPPGETAVLVTAGLAVNTFGQTLSLPCDQRVVLVRPPDPAKRDQCVFADCSDGPSANLISGGTGYYLLTITEASQPEGKAAVSGLGNNLAPCNSRYWAEGVKFRLVKLKLASVTSPNTERNGVAYQCFGWPDRKALQFIQDALGDKDPAPYGFESKIDGPYSLDHDVALALVHWTSTGLDSIEPWAVRRKIVHTANGRPMDPLLFDRHIAEGEAMLQQFQDQISDLLSDGSAGLAAASARFSYLPPVGFLPVGSGRFDWKVFLGQHAPLSETPLDPGLVRSVIRSALERDPVEVVAAGSGSSVSIIPFHVYRIFGVSDSILFSRFSLDEILADDVAFDDSTSHLGANDVQAAIDALAAQRRVCCSIAIAPGPNWQLALEQLPPNEDAAICFQPGVYTLTKPALIKNKGHLLITGAGRGSRIVASGSEAALIIRACKSVTVSQLSFEGGSAADLPNQRHINGALTIENCPEVHIEQVNAKCADAKTKNTACIVVIGSSDSTTTPSADRARIVRCDCEVGPRQIGILVVDVLRSIVEENNVHAAAGTTPSSFPYGDQGIVIAGQKPSELRVLNNTVDRFLKGIHVGFSHRGATQDVRDSAESVMISSNSITIFLPIALSRERHGILVGNSRSIIVENNRLKLERGGKGKVIPKLVSREMKVRLVQVDGIRVFGEVGGRLIVRGNHLENVASGQQGFSVGIRFRPLTIPAENEKRVWVVTENAMIASPTISDIADDVKPFVSGLDLNYA